MSDNTYAYFDYVAATPVEPPVLDAMLPFMSDGFYNPSSLYSPARDAKAALEAARHRLAMQLGAKTSEIIFTSGATESNNLALGGVHRAFPGSNIVTTHIEHEAILAVVPAAKIAAVSAGGILDPHALVALADDQTVIFSVQYASSEIGTIQPLAKIAAVVRDIRSDRKKRGIELPLYFHTDATAAANYLDLHVERLGVDLLSLSGSKIYGPKGTGLLYIRTGVQIAPLVLGGGQERGLRSGTENVPGAVGLATALELVQASRQAETRRLTELRSQLAETALRVAGVRLNAHQSKCLPSILNLSIDGLDGETLVLYLEQKGILAGTGSACHTGRGASHVLEAIGATGGSLRLSLGRGTTPEDIDRFTTVFPGLVAHLRRSAVQ